MPLLSSCFSLVARAITWTCLKGWQKDARPLCGETTRRVFIQDLEAAFAAEMRDCYVTFGAISCLVSCKGK